MNCNRAGCSNIGNRRSYKYGELCEDCFNELVELGSATDVYEFMISPKGTIFGDDREKAIEKFDKIFIGE